MEEIVHVVPLGWEYDRVVLPLERFRAHRVYLLCDPTGHPNRVHFLRKVSATLKRRGIEVRSVQVDTFMDLAGTMREVSRIVQSEQNRGARVHVNVSAAGRLGAIGASLAAMAHLKPGQGSIYYVPVIDYPTTQAAQLLYGMSRGMKGDPIDLPLFELTLPNLAARMVLSLLLESDTKSLRYSEVRKLLAAHGFTGYGSLEEGTSTREQKTRWNVNLYRKVVLHLARLKLVEIDAVGRDHSLKLTRAGEFMACLSLLTEDSPDLRQL